MLMKRIIPSAAALTVVAAFHGAMLSACNGESLVVGGADGGSAPAGETTTPTPSGPPGIAATWTGYIENKKFLSGSDKITITFTSESTGTVRLGDTILSPPTDPNVGYPPGIPANDTRSENLVEGFPFTMLALGIGGARRTFSIQLNELWKDWCPLQQSISDPAQPTGYGCVRNAAAKVGPQCSYVDTGEIVDCAKFELCMRLRVCACTAAGCSAQIDPYVSQVVNFDLHFGETTADGTTPFGFARLERQP